MMNKTTNPALLQTQNLPALDASWWRPQTEFEAAFDEWQKAQRKAVR